MPNTGGSPVLSTRYSLNVCNGSWLLFRLALSGSMLVKMHLFSKLFEVKILLAMYGLELILNYLVHGFTLRNTTFSPTRTHFHESSSYANGPFTTKFGRNCSAVTLSSNRELSSVSEPSFTIMYEVASCNTPCEKSFLSIDVLHACHYKAYRIVPIE